MAKKVSPASSPQSPSSSSPTQAANSNPATAAVAPNATSAAAAPAIPAAKKNVSADGQKECCIMGCSNPASKRSRFSLRLYKDKDFKPDFMENNWNKVCERHYFQDLYQFKKLNKTTTVRNASKSGSNSNSSEMNNLNSNAKEMESEASDNNNGSLGSNGAQIHGNAHQTEKTSTKKEKKNASKKNASKKRDFETMAAAAAPENASSATPTDSVAPVAKKRKIWTLKEKTLLIHKIATLDEETVKRIIDVITSSCPGSCNFFHNEDTLEVDVNKFDESTFEKIQIVVGEN